MITIYNTDITDMTEGVIIHQVNCQGAIGAGVSGAIIRKYPIVEKEYYQYVKNEEACNRVTFGTTLCVQVTDKLKIANVFTQLNYGNSKKTGIKYTDENLLIETITNICHSTDSNVYIPKYIGCGLAGGDWGFVERQLDIENLDNLRIVSLESRE